MPIKIKVISKWYDIWIGVFVDRKNQAIYIFLIPCLLGIKITWFKNLFKLYGLEEEFWKAFPKKKPWYKRIFMKNKKVQFDIETMGLNGKPYIIGVDPARPGEDATVLSNWKKCRTTECNNILPLDSALNYCKDCWKKADTGI